MLRCYLSFLNLDLDGNTTFMKKNIIEKRQNSFFSIISNGLFTFNELILFLFNILKNKVRNVKS